jgi:hypothetical protein
MRNAFCRNQVQKMRHEPLIGGGVLASTALTDAVYVLFNAAVAQRRRLGAAMVEQHLVSALRFRGNQLYAQSRLCNLRRGRLMDRRILRDDLAWTQRRHIAVTASSRWDPWRFVTAACEPVLERVVRDRSSAFATKKSGASRMTHRSVGRFIP